MSEAGTMIRISRSHYIASLECPRKVWLGYHYPKALTGGVVDGLGRKRANSALTTGGAVHHGLAALLRGATLQEAVIQAIQSYDDLTGSFQVEGEVPSDVAYLVAEQTALIKALLTAWYRIRRAVLLEEYEVLDIEREEAVMLAPDVQFQARPDAILKRRADGALFLLSFKTSSEARWLRRYENDMQTISEVVAVEGRLGVKLAGVIIEGLLKGRRVSIAASGHEVRDEVTPVVRVIQRSPLIYGYKFDGNPPLEPPAYDYESTRKKGWYRFPVWESPLAGGLAYWVNWLPEEVVAAQLVTMPPILRQEPVVEAWKRQIVGRARADILAANEVALEAAVRSVSVTSVSALDQLFPQNDAACDRFGSKTNRCPFWDCCWTGNVGEDPIRSGLYVARSPNHPIGEDSR